MAVIGDNLMTDGSRKFLNILRSSLASIGAEGSSLVIGVSGGADSVALLCGVCLLREELHIDPAVVHVNHQLRSSESDQDAIWVRDLCRRLEVPIQVVDVDVSEQAADRRIGIEEAARDARYDVLHQAAKRLNVSTIALAHNADDQIETALHHLLRGTGLAGLKGMPSTRALSDRVQIVRPLLSIKRAEIEAFLASLGQDFRSDSSNLDTSLTRNFLRHELLPLLEQRLNPQVREHLLRLTQQASEWHGVLQQQASQILNAALLDESPSVVRLRCEPFKDQPRPLVREAFVVLWARRGWPRQAMAYSHWEALAEVAQNDDAKSVNLPLKMRARRRGSLIEVDATSLLGIGHQ